MSRASIRSAVASYLSSANITTLNSVKPFPAKFTPEMDFYDDEDPGVMTGSIIYIYIESQRERRLEMASHQGRKEVEYSVVLDCFTRSQEPKSEDAGASAEAFLDSLVSSIRSDFQAGAQGVIFQWGEGTTSGGQDIDVVSYYPRMIRGRAGTTQVYSRVRLTVIELITA